MKIEALGRTVVVSIKEPDEHSLKGGEREYVVVDVGDVDDVSIGDRVCVGSVGLSFTEGGVKYAVVDEKDVLGVIEE